MHLEETFPLSLDFADVALQQNKNRCKSRSDAKIDSEVLRGLTLSVPLISSNMSSVTDAEFAKLMAKNGGLGILHRAWPDKREYLLEVQHLSKEGFLAAASVGVGEGQLELAMDLIRFGARIITIDIAHGYSDEVFDLCRRIKKYDNGVRVIVGNTTNPDMVIDADGAGADAVKVGIANGLACETKDTAACYEKQFSAVLKFGLYSKKYGMPIISDGGIRRPADFVLAMAAGASSVMAGSIFARCPESAAPTENVNDVVKKVYSGMASRAVQQQWKGGLRPGTCPEGKTVYLDMGEPVANLMERYAGALRSGITYTGATNIKEFQEMARFVRFK